MILDLEVRIVDQHRVIQVEGREQQPLPVAWDQMNPVLHILQGSFKTDFTVKDTDTADMERRSSRLAIEEACVLG
jgi:hypothetical protein